jgi:hypothetical protein
MALLAEKWRCKQAGRQTKGLFEPIYTILGMYAVGAAALGCLYIVLKNALSGSNPLPSRPGSASDASRDP